MRAAGREEQSGWVASVSVPRKCTLGPFPFCLRALAHAHRPRPTLQLNQVFSLLSVLPPHQAIRMGGGRCLGDQEKLGRALLSDGRTCAEERAKGSLRGPRVAIRGSAGGSNRC